MSLFGRIFSRSSNTSSMASNSTTKVDIAQYPQPELAKHDSSVLDLAFAMDCTGSMGSYIHQAQQNIRKIVETIVSEEKSDVNLALVQYRDHPPQDRSFVTNTNDFTESVSKMKGWLDGCHASGGGDRAEAVADALHDVLKLSWRQNATKICVFIADAPPHGLESGSGDGFPNGCPNGLDPMAITQQLAEKGITLYMVGCEPAITPVRDFFMALAHITGGQYVPLGNATMLSKVIIGGAQEEITLQRLQAEVERDVIQEAQRAEAEGREWSEDAVAENVCRKYKSQGVRVKQLQFDGGALPQTSAFGKDISVATNMAEVKSKFSKNAAPPSRGFSFGAAPPPPPGAAAPSGATALFGSSEADFDMVQASRMVHKAKRANKLF